MSLTVSVVIPTFNYQRYIAEAIQSVFDQTYPIDEIIVVDDGSTDGTSDVVKAFRDVRYVEQKNAGVAAARNKGTELSSADVIAFLDSDDIWLPNKIQKQIECLEADSIVGLVHCGMREFDSDTGETLNIIVEGEEGWVAQKMLFFDRPTVNCSGSSILIRKEAFSDVGGFDQNPDLHPSEDWEFCFRVARLYKVAFVPEALFNYRSHGSNAHMNIPRLERSSRIAWEKAFQTTDEKILGLRRNSYADLYKMLAGSYWHQGKYGHSLRNVAKSLWFRPRYLGHYTARLVGGK